MNDADLAALSAQAFQLTPAAQLRLAATLLEHGKVELAREVARLAQNGPDGAAAQVVAMRVTFARDIVDATASSEAARTSS